jgi:hypothetical protein
MRGAGCCGPGRPGRGPLYWPRPFYRAGHRSRPSSSWAPPTRPCQRSKRAAPPIAGHAGQVPTSLGALTGVRLRCHIPHGRRAAPGRLIWGQCACTGALPVRGGRAGMDVSASRVGRPGSREGIKEASVLAYSCSRGRARAGARTRTAAEQATQSSPASGQGAGPGRAGRVARAGVSGGRGRGRGGGRRARRGC